MNRDNPSGFDVAVIGAGPVGSVAALAHARKGARVVLIEANPKSARRLAGEWLHPPSLAILGGLGIDLSALHGRYPTGEGFVMFPDDGLPPVMLPYANGKRGFSVDHETLVEMLRAAATAHPNVRYMPQRRVVKIADGHLVVAGRGMSATSTVTADRIIGADGRHSVVRAVLSPPTNGQTGSYMVGLRLEGANLPFEGYGHVFVGGLGPALAYRIESNQLRLLLDLPVHRKDADNRAARLWDGYGPVLPKSLRDAFRGALERNAIEMAHTPIMARTAYGDRHLAVVGDAAGHLHPLTALGITLGFDDAVSLADCATVTDYSRRRRRQCLVPQMVAIGIYETFAGGDDAAVAVRRAVVDIWRRSPTERERTMKYISCEDRRLAPFARSFLRVMGETLGHLALSALKTGAWRQPAATAGKVFQRAYSWIATVVTPMHKPAQNLAQTARDTPIEPAVAVNDIKTQDALARGVESLKRLQRDDGGWEGEVVWCPMLAAQYVLACFIMGVPISDVRRRRLKLHFTRTRLPSGLWGLHAHSEPYLFVTTLVYVAARILGMAGDDPLLVPAREFIRREDVVNIPGWGKFWLAMLGLYRWEGINPILPEIWRLPRWVPLHPAHYYCHTRQIYMAMAAIYGRKYAVKPTAVTEALRSELYPQGFDLVDFTKTRLALRLGDLYETPGFLLQLLYRAAGLIEQFHGKKSRARIIAEFQERIRWELRTTSHTSISPVSGLLNLIVLWLADPADPDLMRGLQSFEGWIWEDDKDGLRVTGARSVSWDTAFALQALAVASPHVPVKTEMNRGISFLAMQQIRTSFEGYTAADRIDPKGGWCFAGVWHGWPVSDCTAEAITALLQAVPSRMDIGQLTNGILFILRCQNHDGGFGSYEPRRVRADLERLNPAEMFAGSMTEASFVECTASCLVALAKFRRHIPNVMEREIDRAVGRAAGWLRRCQREDGAWPAVWGVNLIYGTMFGIDGLRAAEIPPFDPAILKACNWLKGRQRADGGWGEHHSGCRTQSYVEHRDGQTVQTAWALRALLEAFDPDYAAIERGARFLGQRQNPDGTWPAEDMAGVFFRTALLDYTLYRSYFPIWALALFEARRKEREGFAAQTPTVIAQTTAARA